MAMTDQETKDVLTMCDELQALLDSGAPGAKGAYMKLHRLGNQKGDEWEATARMFLAERAAKNPPAVAAQP